MAHNVNLQPLRNKSWINQTQFSIFFFLIGQISVWHSPAENYKSELKHNQIIFPDQRLWQSIWSPPQWAPMAGVLSVTVLVLRHVPEITDPQESRHNEHMKGLVGAELTLNSILLNLEKQLRLIAHAGKVLLYIVQHLDYCSKSYI